MFAGIPPGEEAMKAALVTPLPVQECLEGEQRSEIRHGCVAGQVYALTGTNQS